MRCIGESGPGEAGHGLGITMTGPDGTVMVEVVETQVEAVEAEVVEAKKGVQVQVNWNRELSL